MDFEFFRNVWWGAQGMESLGERTLLNCHRDGVDHSCLQRIVGSQRLR